MSKNVSLTNRIEQHYATLSRAGQSIANYLQLHPLAITSMSVTELSRASGTSKATVSRFFRQLGYESHQDAKKQLLAKRTAGFPIADSESKPDGLQQEFAQELENVKRTLDGITEQSLNAIAERLANAKRVLLIGYRNSYPLALTFSQQLKQIRSDIQLLPLPAQTIAEELVDIQNGDFIVLVGFRRRPRVFQKLVTELKGQPTLLLTDPSGQVYNQDVEHLLVCQLGHQLAFDSYAAPMSVIALLCNRVYDHIGEQGQQRTTRISDLYDSFNELS